MRRPEATPRPALLVLLGVALATLSACATLGIGGGGGSADLEIRVTNDLGGFERVSVSLLDSEGNRQTLGDVDAGEMRSFDATGDLESDLRYRLMAEPRRGETILSPEIVVRERSIVTWSLRDNQVRVFEARDEPGG